MILIIAIATTVNMILITIIIIIIQIIITIFSPQYLYIFSILQTESMNGMLTPARVFSRISLALMEDTGWYIPDYEMADKLNWGKDLGCDFVQKSCKNWIDTRING